MQRSETDRISRGAFAALVLLGLALSLSGCATVPAGHTQLSWPVGTTYTVRSGDTLSEIAESYSLSDTQLVAYNRLGDPDRIYPGQVLRIPRDSYRVASTSPAPRPYYAPRRAVHHEPRYEKRYARRAEPKPRPAPQRVEEAQAYSGPLHFIWPVAGHVISSFGETANGGRNDGINISATVGEPIRAAAAGNVIYAGNELKGYGNLVLIRHEDGYVTAYAHAERIAVVRGTHVKKGEVIGYAGSTGDVTRPQLHFEIRRGVRPVDPKPLAGRFGQLIGRLADPLAELARQILHELPGHAARPPATLRRPGNGPRPQLFRRHIQSIMHRIGRRSWRGSRPARNCGSPATARSGRTARPSPPPPRTD